MDVNLWMRAIPTNTTEIEPPPILMIPQYLYMKHPTIKYIFSAVLITCDTCETWLGCEVSTHEG